ncbi:LysR family transcriptional regulator [Leeia sp.]|uniref:LysR family transcriptional regulator n=1 Tax=Leeia sp. TaxID=2884678 RepID=UPI0035B492F1
MDQIVALRSLLQVVQHGSFSAAARSLSVAVSSLTRQIDGLERGLGTRLLIRSTHGLHLTEAGEWLLQKSRLPLMDVEAALQQVSALDQALQGRIKLTAPLNFGRRLLPPLLVSFLQQHPAVEIDLRLSDHYQRIALEGFDMGIRVGQQHDPDLLVFPATAHRPILCASPDYLSHHGTPAEARDLHQHACLPQIVLDQPASWTLLVNGEAWKFVPRGPLQSDRSEVLYEAACAGLGIADMPYWLASEALQQSRLVQVLPQHPLLSPLGDQVYIVIPPHRRQSPRVRALRDHVLLHLAKVDDA